MLAEQLKQTCPFNAMHLPSYSMNRNLPIPFEIINVPIQATADCSVRVK